MRIIAFDLGRNFAFAHNAIDGKLTTETIFLKPEQRAHRFIACFDWLDARIGQLKLDAVVYETPFARGRDPTRSLWGYAALIEAIASRYKLPVMDVATPTIKKSATGHGKASKYEMIFAAQRMGYTGRNEHMADAVCLLRYAEANLERVLS